MDKIINDKGWKKIKISHKSDAHGYEVESYFINGVDEFDSKVNLDWIKKDLDYKENLTEVYQSQKAINKILLKMIRAKDNKEFNFYIVLTGKALIESKYIDSEFISKFFNNLQTNDINGQGIINPNSQIPITRQKLKNGTTNPIFEIGDFYESISATLSGKHDVEKDMKMISRDSISISNKINTSLKNPEGIESLVKLLGLIIEVNERNNPIRNIDFLEKENDEEIIKKLNLEFLDKVKSRSITQNELNFTDLKIEDPNSLCEWKLDSIIKSNDFKKGGKFEKLNFIEALESFEFYSKGKETLEFNDIFDYLVEVHRAFLIAKEDQDIDEHDFLYKSLECDFIKFKCRSDVKTFSILKLIDVWGMEVDFVDPSGVKNWFMMSGIWYKLNDSYAEKLNKAIASHERDNTIQFGAPSDLKFWYPLKWLGNNFVEEDHNKILVSMNVGEAERILNLDKYTPKTNGGSFEVADTIIKKGETLYLIANKQSDTISVCHRVFEQAAISINNIATYGIKEKLMKHFGVEHIKYIITIQHNQNDVTSLKSKAKSLTFRKQLNSFVGIANKYSFKPEVYILKKDQEDDEKTDKLISAYSQLEDDSDYKQELESFKDVFKEI